MPHEGAHSHWDLDENLSLDDAELEMPSEKITLNSVGIDIGSSTSHLIFSRLVLRRRGDDYHGGYTVVSRDILYSSPILLTPYYENNRSIDTNQLRTFIQDNYEQAGFAKGDIDTGAVITTGEAALKENARNIIELFAQETGKFVTASAGPNQEAVLAAHGSGAVRLSVGQHGTIMNVDIGGGTTKAAIVRQGRVLETVVIHMGARLVAWDESGKINRIEEAGRKIAEELGLQLEIGQRIHDEDKERLSDWIAGTIIRFILQEPLQRETKYLVTEPLKQYYDVDCFVFSGGLSEYIYRHEKEEYGDLGKILGEQLRQRLSEKRLHVHEPLQFIRATVIGASQYTVQVSGNTIYLSHPDILPVRNLPVIPIQAERGMEHVHSQIRQGYNRLDLECGKDKVALSVSWNTEPSFENLRQFVDGLDSALQSSAEHQVPLVLILNQDIAELIGNAVVKSGKFTGRVVVIDLIHLREMDYVDIGQMLESKAVPVTVKSLIFR